MDKKSIDGLKATFASGIAAVEADLEKMYVNLCNAQESADEQRRRLPQVDGHEALWLFERLGELRDASTYPWQLRAIDELRDWLNKKRGGV